MSNTLKSELHIVIRCNASPAIGFGHFMRCVSMAEQIRAIHSVCRITFVLNPFAFAYAQQHGLHFTCVSTEVISTQQETTYILDTLQPSGIILDGYEFDASYENALTASCEVLRLDDGQLWRRNSSVQWLLNSAPGATEHAYRHLNAALFLGTEYHPLRQSILTTAKQPPARDGKTLLMFGGSDSLNLTLSVTKLVAAQLNLRVIAGPGMQASAQHALRAYCQQHRIEYHLAPSNLDALMASSTQAITAAGSTVYELAALNTPCIAVQVADNQQPLCSWLKRQEILVLNHTDIQQLAEPNLQHAFRTPGISPGTELPTALMLWLRHLPST